MSLRFWHATLLLGLVTSACGQRPAAPTATTVPPARTRASQLPIPTETIADTAESIPTVQPTPTLRTTTYADPGLNITFQYPETWQQVGGLEFRGSDGFLKIDRLPDYHSTDIFHVCIDYAYRNFPPASVEPIPFAGCSIYPASPPSPEDTITWIFHYRSTFWRADYLILKADYAHFRGIVDSIEFNEPPFDGYPDFGTTPQPVQESLPSGMTIQEYPTGSATVDEYGFISLDDARYYGGAIQFYAYTRPRSENCGESIVVQGETWSAGEGDSHSIEVKRYGQEVFTIPYMSPIGGDLHSFCEWDGQWVLETQGFLVIDGRVMNHEWGYDEIFDWRLLAGRPFYFFSKDGYVHVSYDGQVLPVSYDSVEHYNCCMGPGAFNPAADDTTIGFYGVRDGNWYYVEIMVE